VVFDEAEFSKFVHEDIHARARSTDYFRQSPLGNNWRFVRTGSAGCRLTPPGEQIHFLVLLLGGLDWQEAEDLLL